MKNAAELSKCVGAGGRGRVRKGYIRNTGWRQFWGNFDRNQVDKHADPNTPRVILWLTLWYLQSVRTSGSLRMLLSRGRAAARKLSGGATGRRFGVADPLSARKCASNLRNVFVLKDCRLYVTVSPSVTSLYCTAASLSVTFCSWSCVLLASRGALGCTNQRSLPPHLYCCSLSTVRADRFCNMMAEGT